MRLENVFIVVAMAWLSACTRGSEVSQIRIQFPVALNQSASGVNVSVATTSSPWSGQITSKASINCYFVTVGTPELSNNVCKQKTTGTELVRFGPYEGGKPAGSELILEVPSGSARKISLFAMQAQNGYCTSFKGTGPTPGKISHPRLIETKTVDLAPGSVDVSFTVPNDLSSLPEVDECQVNDMPQHSPVAESFWGDGRDGDLAASSFQYLDGIYDDYSVVTHTPASSGVPTSKIFSFNSKISNIDTALGTTITLAEDITSTNQLAAGDKIIWHVVSGWSATNPDSNACGGNLARGMFGMSRVVSVDLATDTLLLENPITTSPATLNNTSIADTGYSNSTEHCNIQLARVSQFGTITMSGITSLQMTMPGWSPANGRGGLMAVFIKNLDLGTAGTLAINMTGNGHPGASAGAFGISGGGSGTASDNRGGVASTFGGGGGNGGDGGAGSSSAGVKINLCSGLPCHPLADKRLIFGGGGGGDGSSAGGNGGGVLFVAIENISGTGQVNLNASGGQANYTSVGAGAGGSIAFFNKSSVAGATVNLTAAGGNANTSAGGDGGGGIIDKAVCQSQQSATYNVGVLAGSGGTGNPTVGETQSVNLETTNPTYCQ